MACSPCLRLSHYRTDAFTEIHSSECIVSFHAFRAMKMTAYAVGNVPS